tara:strand:+ start:5059 stop:6054 length:996 start_codon:yes stop_codon:yes gene_type:complete
MPPKTIREYFGPSSTGVHNNIDDLILQAELDKFAQTGTVGVDRTPEYIGGTDDVVANIAMSPLMTLKTLGNVGKKIIEKTGLRNPVSHFTGGESAKNILESGTIRGASESFPGKPFYKDSRKYLDKQLNRDKSGWLSETDIKFQKQLLSSFPMPKSPAVSVTRDPMFTSRYHNNIGTDIRFVLDRDELIKKGLKISPYVELSGMPGYSKTLNSYGRGPITLDNYKKIHGYYPDQMNPRFEFEERVRGYIPTENIKLIDILQLPLGQSIYSNKIQNLLSELAKTNIPIIKSELAKDRLSKIPIGREREGAFKDVYKLLETPTYKFDPFKKTR